MVAVRPENENETTMCPVQTEGDQRRHQRKEQPDRGRGDENRRGAEKKPSAAEKKPQVEKSSYPWRAKVPWRKVPAQVQGRGDPDRRQRALQEGAKKVPKGANGASSAGAGTAEVDQIDDGEQRAIAKKENTCPWSIHVRGNKSKDAQVRRVRFAEPVVAEPLTIQAQSRKAQTKVPVRMAQTHTRNRYAVLADIDDADPEEPQEREE